MRGNLGTAIAVSIVHAAAMIVSGGIVAFAVHEWLGLRFISKSWFNLDVVWALSLILVGAIGLMSAGLVEVEVLPQLRRSRRSTGAAPTPVSPPSRLRRGRQKGAAGIWQRLAAGTEEIAQQKEAGRAESVGDLLDAELRPKHSALA